MITFPIEYVISFMIVVMNTPVARLSPAMKIKMGSGFSIDLCVVYYILNAISVPYFIVTAKKSWNKRKVYLDLARVKYERYVASLTKSQ